MKQKLNAILYFLGYGCLYLLSLLPFWLLYAVSTVFAFLLRDVFKYRRSIVLANIEKCFPEKSREDRALIANDFYSRFCDNFIETLKLLSISKRELQKRFKVSTDLLERTIQSSDKSITIVLGHFFNWEMANLAMSLKNPFQQLIIYASVRSNFFEQFMIRLRERFSTKMLSAYDFSKEIRKWQKDKYSLILAADQNPQLFVHKAYWVDFFGHPVPFVKGPERGAIMQDNVVLFAKINRIKRGYYSNDLLLVTNNARQTEKGEITRTIIRLIEENIQADPANYLWSHRRFKHVYQPAYAANRI